MANETSITLCGRLADDPQLRFTPAGAAACNFRLLSTPRSFDKQRQEWVDGETLGLNCTAWRQLAENCAESLTKGMAVVVTGRLKSRSYEAKDGSKRTVFEIDVEDVGASLKFATVTVQKSGGQRQQPQQPQGRDPWQGQQRDPWSQGGSDTEPPF